MTGINQLSPLLLQPGINGTSSEKKSSAKRVAVILQALIAAFREDEGRRVVLLAYAFCLVDADS